MIKIKRNMSKWFFFSILILISIIILVSELFLFNQSMGEKLWIFYYHKGFIKTLIYIVSYFSAVVFFGSIFFTRQSFLFSTLFILLTFPYLINISYFLINGYGFGSHELQVLLGNANNFSNDAWTAYSPYMIRSFLLFTCILLIGLLIRIFINKNNLLIDSKYIMLLGLISFITTFSVVFKTINTVSKYPVYMSFYNTIAYHLINRTYYGEREKLSTTPDSKSRYNNLIWIVDESISYSHLSINGYEKETTPYLNSIKEKYVNLGRSSSIGNCSSMTNIALMSGIQLDQLPDKANYSLKSPSIFQYAKNAGYTTHYISGQSHDDLLQNYMTEFDMKYIDGFYQPNKVFKDDIVPEGDIINKVNDAIDQNEKNFIFIVKRGAHFHWAGQTPDNKKVFKPTLNESDALILENKEKAVNSYSNNIKYRVDDFFKEFFLKTKILNDSESFIVYTSDHGQSILEGNSNGTHCDSTNPNLSQGIVPLLIFANKDEELISKLPKNSFSHFEIFPTTLKLMGYQSYLNGYTFFDKPDSKQIFSSGDIFGRASFYLNDISQVRD